MPRINGLVMMYPLVKLLTNTREKKRDEKRKKEKKKRETKKKRKRQEKRRSSICYGQYISCLGLFPHFVYTHAQPPQPPRDRHYQGTDQDLYIIFVLYFNASLYALYHTCNRFVCLASDLN